jgi:hypothetical protein
MSEQVAPNNSCARAEHCLPDYWHDELSCTDRAWLDQHLETCDDCAELATFWRKLGQLPEAKPDPLQRQRFDVMLAAYVAAPSRLSWIQGWQMLMRPLPLGFALVLLLTGLGGGWWLRGVKSPTQDQAGEIAGLREEVHDTRQLVVLSMLQQQSANDRLAGINYSNRLSPLDPQILQALLHSLQYDPSTDVRLAAIDALEHAGSGREAAPAVTSGLVEAFPYQNSPLVQVALVDSFVDLRPPAARALLQKVSTDLSYGPEVRQRAAWGLSHWN